LAEKFRFIQKIDWLENSKFDQKIDIGSEMFGWSKTFRLAREIYIGLYIVCKILDWAKKL